MVAIGITADSFIVYFERLRDEVRDGKTLRPAVEAGWKRARRTILVSDTVSFLAAVLLYHFAISDVQGFAYTLGLTTLIDVLVVFLFTKPMVTLLAGTKFFGSGNKWSGLDPERLGAKTPWRSATRRTVRTQRPRRHRARPAGGSSSTTSQGGMMAGVGGIAGRLYRGEVSVNFVGRQRMWYTISGLILLVSVVALLVRGLNFTVEFKGGSIFQFPARSRAAPPRARSPQVVTTAGGGDATVQHVSLEAADAVDGDDQGAVASTCSRTSAIALEHAFHIPQNQMTSRSSARPGAARSPPRPIEALIIFLVVIVIYLTIAFEWRMAVAAFVALLHDIVITIGVYALTGFQVTPTTVIGLLTILGYSLYDTVVVFDKVRENTAGLLTTPALHLQRRGQPGAEPDAGPVDQHLADRAASRSRRSCSSARACSARARSRTCRWCCSSACCRAPTPRSSSPPRCWPTSRSASRSTRTWRSRSSAAWRAAAAPPTRAAPPAPSAVASGAPPPAAATDRAATAATSTAADEADNDDDADNDGDGVTVPRRAGPRRRRHRGTARPPAGQPGRSREPAAAPSAAPARGRRGGSPA